MKIRILRSGGFLGLKTDQTLDTDELSQELLQKLERLLESEPSGQVSREGLADAQTTELRLVGDQSERILLINDATASDDALEMVDELIEVIRSGQSTE